MTIGAVLLLLEIWKCVALRQQPLRTVLFVTAFQVTLLLDAIRITNPDWFALATFGLAFRLPYYTPGPRTFFESAAWPSLLLLVALLGLDLLLTRRQRRREEAVRGTGE